MIAIHPFQLSELM